MSKAKHYKTALEDSISVFQKIAYGFGMLCNNLIPAALGCMAVVLNLGLGMNPALIGYIMSFPRFVDAFTDPVMGYVSDNTRSRFGRRRPYIFFGAIISGIIFALIWQLGTGHSEMFYFWFFLIGCILLFVGTTVFATPFIALGYELTPDYHERTRVMAWANWFGQIPWLLCPWFWWIMANKNFFNTPVEGARTIALAVGSAVVVLGILPAIFCKERYESVVKTEDKVEIPEYNGLKEMKRLFHDTKNYLSEIKCPEWMGILAYTGIIICKVLLITFIVEFITAKAALSVKGAMNKIAEFLIGFLKTIIVPSFLKLCTATFFLFNGFMLVSGLGMYVLIYFVFGGDTVMGGKYNGLFGTTSALSTIFIVIPLVTKLSTKVGKRKAFIISTSISILGFLMKWWCFNPDYVHLIVIKDIFIIPLLPAVFIAFGIGGLFTTVGSMMADTCDLDELNTGHRREGVFGAIYWWTVKLGMSIAFAFSGHILNASGFNVELGSNQAARSLFLLRIFDITLPIITSLIAILAVVFYKITEEKAHEIRLELEKRRGHV